MEYDFEPDPQPDKPWPTSASGQPMHPKLVALRESLINDPPKPRAPNPYRPEKPSKPIEVDENGRVILPAPTTKPKRGDYNNRAKTYMEGAGYTYYRVDHFDHAAGVARDLLGIFDGLALRTGEIVGVQVTSKTNRAARVRKMVESVALRRWLDAGGRALVLSFETGKTGADERWVTAQDLAGER